MNCFGEVSNTFLLFLSGTLTLVWAKKNITTYLGDTVRYIVIGRRLDPFPTQYKCFIILKKVSSVDLVQWNGVRQAKSGARLTSYANGLGEGMKDSCLAASPQRPRLNCRENWRSAKN